MASIKINLEKELTTTGIYKSEGLWYGSPRGETEKLDHPISPKENLKRYYRGEDYEWIPDLNSDQYDITPDCNPDCVASGYAGGYDTFGVKWIPVENNEMLPAFVEPGFVLLDNIADWKKLEWPDVDSWNWAECAEKYNQTLEGDDRMRRGVLMSGYFERLISMMTFEEAAVSLLADPEAVGGFFDKLTDMNIKIADHYIDDFGCGAIMIHDDWAAQKSPFFSLDMAMELIVPHLKRLVDHVHARGAFFTLHSCGNGVALVPAMKAAGVDAWQANDTAIDIEGAIKACGDDLILEIYPEVPDLHGEALKKHVFDTVTKYCSNDKCFIEFSDYTDFERPKETRKYFYEIGRKLVCSK